MNIVFFAHPDFLGSQSMPRFAKMLSEGMKNRKHTIEVWSPQARFFKLKMPGAAKKWLGYVDQFMVFPAEVVQRVKKCSPDTLFVFMDQALGPWVPLVANRPNVIHCHDFLAQLSALGKVQENPTGWSGKQYQNYIRRGYSQGRNFISVSNKTKDDLHQMLISQPELSEVVYNGLNKSFTPRNPIEARYLLGTQTNFNIKDGYILHVGGNQWYKNRLGVIEIYNAWRSKGDASLPLLLIGNAPSAELLAKYTESPFKMDIHFLTGGNDDLVRLAYAGAALFLFPSLAEGFGWPIAEAMASGAPVITTNEAPMTEVAGDAAFLISRRPENVNLLDNWAADAAIIVDKVINLTADERELAVKAGIQNAQRFNSEQALDQIELIYQRVVSEHIKSLK